MLFFVALVYTKNTLYKLLSSVILVFKLINAYSRFKVSKIANQIAAMVRRSHISDAYNLE